MQRRSILLIEDDDTIRELLQMELEHQGFTVVPAGNGQEGLEALRHMSRPCLILLDLMMPIMDGWQFAERVQADADLAQIPLVVFSAAADTTKTVKAAAILRKPTDFRVIMDVVHAHCS